MISRALHRRFTGLCASDWHFDSLCWFGVFGNMGWVLPLQLLWILKSFCITLVFRVFQSYIATWIICNSYLEEKLGLACFFLNLSKCQYPLHALILLVSEAILLCPFFSCSFSSLFCRVSRSMTQVAPNNLVYLVLQFYFCMIDSWYCAWFMSWHCWPDHIFCGQFLISVP